MSGYIILLDRAVRIGDLVTVDARHGVVKEIASRYTVIRSLDGTESIIPNETLITQAVTNHSFTDRKVVVKVKLSEGYGSEMDRGFALLLDIARRQPRVLADPAPDCVITLWILACALAWPMAAIYGEADLLALIPVGSASVLIAGFASTSLMTLRRRLAVGRLVWLELTGQVLTLLVRVGWALLHPSVWAIVAGGIVSALFRTTASHVMDIGYRNGFFWDHDARHRVVELGKWVYGSSALTFVGRESDRLLLGHFMGVATLGIYTIAVVISEAVGAAVERITRGVLFPVLSEIQRNQPEKVRAVYYDARLRLDGVGLPLLGALMALAQTVIEILYDPRYSDAGWMLQALCLRVAMIALLVPAEVCLFAIGRPSARAGNRTGRQRSCRVRRDRPWPCSRPAGAQRRPSSSPTRNPTPAATLIDGQGLSWT